MAEFKYNVERIIARALRICGKYSYVDNDDILPDDYKIGVENLNSILQDWLNEGVRPQYIKELTLYATQGLREIGINFHVVNILDGIVVDEATEEQSTLQFVPYEQLVQYYNVSDNSLAEGKPSLIAIRNNKLLVYPIPDSGYVFKLNAVCFLEQIDDANKVLYITPNFYEALVYALAVRFADEFMLPVNDKLIFEKRANSLFQRATSIKTMTERQLILPPNGGIV